MGFWRSTISGVLATILAGMAVWLAGFWPDIWMWIKSAAVSTWGWTNQPIGIPLWLVVIGTLYAAIATLILWSLSQPALTAHAATAQEPDPPLTDLQSRVLTYLIQADGKWADWDHLHWGTGLPNLIVEQSLDALLQRELVIQRRDVLHGQLFRLSSKGRDYAIGSGLVNVQARYG